MDWLLENLIYFTGIVILCRFLIDIYYSLNANNDSPKGPKGLPFLGYLPFLGSNPHKSITELSKKYGNVFSLQLGVRKFVVVNNYEAVKEALTSDALLGRPVTTPATIVDPNLSLVDENGSEWRAHRIFANKAFKDIGLGKGLMEDKINEEVKQFVHYIDDNTGKELSIHSILSMSISNNVSELIFGKRFELNDNFLKLVLRQMERLQKHFSNISLLNVSPLILAKMFFKFDSILNRNSITIIDKFYDEEISEHKRREVHTKCDYIDCYLEEMVKRNKSGDHSMTETKLKADCYAFFPSRTSVMIIEWALLLLAKYRNIQSDIQKEIDSVIGNERTPSLTDRPLLPRLQSFIAEVFRYKTNTPFGLLRRAMKDTVISGQKIPKNSDIIVNLYSVHNDSNVWQNPEEFNPKRFLSKDEKKFLKNDALIPFSIGKRSCIAEALGRSEVFLYLVSIIQRFSVINPNESEISLEEEFGLLLEPKHEVVIQFDKR